MSPGPVRTAPGNRSTRCLPGCLWRIACLQDPASCSRYAADLMRSSRNTAACTVSIPLPARTYDANSASQAKPKSAYALPWRKAGELGTN